MDNEALVDQIVRSLSFEVVAVPQDIAPRESTSKATPINVKIKVRKKNDAGLHHGILSMPKVDQKESKIPSRIRLVSSDKTLLSFNMEMEAVFDKVPPKSGTGIKKEKYHQTSLSKSADKYKTAPIVSKRNKDIFGRCKPGGCLDPPFGEEKYAYKPTLRNDSTTDNTTKQRSSSIFRNKIFNRRSKSSIMNEFTKTSIMAIEDSVVSLDKQGLKISTKCSGSLITYPLQSNSSELRLQEERSSKKHKSYEDSKLSVVEGSSYFIMSKQAKNQVNKRDENHNEYVEDPGNKLEAKDRNKLKNTSTSDNDTIELSPLENGEINNNPKFPYIDPFPSFDTNCNEKNTNLDITNKINDEEKKPETYGTNNVAALDTTNTYTYDKCQNQDDEILEIKEFFDTFSENSAPCSLTDIKNKDNNSLATNFTGIVEKKDEIMKPSVKIPITDVETMLIEEGTSNSQLVVKIGNLESSKCISDATILHKKQDVDEYFNDISQARSSTHQNVIPVINEDVKKIMKDEDQERRVSIDIESRPDYISVPLVPETRNKSMLDVTNDISIQENDAFNENVQKESNSQLSLGDLTQIWENKTAPIKSTADVIVPHKNPVYHNNTDTCVGLQKLMDLPNENPKEENFKSHKVSDKGSADIIVTDDTLQNDFDINNAYVEESKLTRSPAQTINEEKLNSADSVLSNKLLLKEFDKCDAGTYAETQTFIDRPEINSNTENLKYLKVSVTGSDNYPNKFPLNKFDENDVGGQKIIGLPDVDSIKDRKSFVESAELKDFTKIVERNLEKNGSNDYGGQTFIDLPRTSSHNKNFNESSNEKNLKTLRVSELVPKSNMMVRNELLHINFDQNDADKILLNLDDENLEFVTVSDTEPADVGVVNKSVSKEFDGNNAEKQKLVESLEEREAYRENVKPLTISVTGSTDVENRNEMPPKVFNENYSDTYVAELVDLPRVDSNKENLKILTKSDIISTDTIFTTKLSPTYSSANSPDTNVGGQKLMNLSDVRSDEENFKLLHTITGSPRSIFHNEVPTKDLDENNLHTYAAEQKMLSSPEVKLNEDFFDSLTISDSTSVKSSVVQSVQSKEDTSRVQLNENIVMLQKSPDNDSNANDNSKKVLLSDNSKNDVGLIITKSSGELHKKMDEQLPSNANKSTRSLNTKLSQKYMAVDLIHPVDRVDNSIIYSRESNLEGSLVDQIRSNVSDFKVKVETEEIQAVMTKNNVIDDGTKSPLRSEQFATEDIRQDIPSTSSIFQKDIGNWKMDLAIQSYVGENNDRVIKTYASENVIDRRKNDTLLLVQCSMDTEVNKIKIPIDHKYDMFIKIKNNRRQNEVKAVTKETSVQTEENQPMITKIDEADSAEVNADFEEVCPSQSKDNNNINSEIRDALKTIYEQELIPLQETIKGLREEIEMLAMYEMKFREKVHNLTPKRSSPLRLISGYKKCACVRRL